MGDTSKKSFEIPEESGESPTQARRKRKRKVDKLSSRRDNNDSIESN